MCLPLSWFDAFSFVQMAEISRAWASINESSAAGRDLFFMKMLNGKYQKLLLLSGLAFILLASLYNVITPAFEAPDEVGHFYNIFHLLTTHSLPNQYTSNSGEAHQPPLYYWIASLGASPADLRDRTGVFRPNPQFMGAGNGGMQINAGLHGSGDTFPYRGQALALHMARLVSSLMGAGTSLLIFILAVQMFPEHPALAWLAAGMAALVPQFLFLSAAVNNDNLLNLLSAAAWMVLYKIMKSPQGGRNWWAAGVLFGLAMLTKLNAVVIALVAGIVLLICARQMASPRYFFANLARFSLPFFFIDSWWLVRNQILYGDPLGFSAFATINAATRRQSPLDLNEIGNFIATQFRSFFGAFGWENVWAPNGYFWLIGVILVSGLMGLIFYSMRKDPSRHHRREFLFLTLIIIMQEAVQFAFILNRDQSFYQGRYLFPIIGPLMILIGFGWLSWLPCHPKTITVSLLAVLLVPAIYMPLQVIRPAYPSIFLPKWRMYLVNYKLDETVSGEVSLRAYQLNAKPGAGKGDLVLYWSPMQVPLENFSATVRIYDSSGQLIVEKSHIPGEKDGQPPDTWWYQDILPDSYQLLLPDESGTLQVEIVVSFPSGKPAAPIRFPLVR
jgi:4-amino-4-deoxy-L-arabinose transferase-like glycosyltransferase